MTKLTKAESNLKNASKSTGPKTKAGKAASVQNSFRHGVLSAHLILPNESRDEYDALLDELQQEFSAQGLLEISLIERIAIALWRQRRLVRAESAQIELQLSVSRLEALNSIRFALNLSLSDPRLEKAWGGLANFESELNANELLEHIHLLNSAIDESVELDMLEQEYPVIYNDLKELAAISNEANLSKYLELNFDDMAHFLNFMLEHYSEQLEDAKIRDLVEVYKRSVALPKVPENMARYQSSLDNELYKAMRALRDAQAWRAERRLNDATVNDSGAV